MTQIGVLAALWGRATVRQLLLYSLIIAVLTGLAADSRNEDEAT